MRKETAEKLKKYNRGLTNSTKGITDKKLKARFGPACAYLLAGPLCRARLLATDAARSATAAPATTTDRVWRRIKSQEAKIRDATLKAARAEILLPDEIGMLEAEARSELAGLESRQPTSNGRSLCWHACTADERRVQGMERTYRISQRDLVKQAPAPPATSAPGLGSFLPHLRRDLLRPSRPNPSVLWIALPFRLLSCVPACASACLHACEHLRTCL